MLPAAVSAEATAVALGAALRDAYGADARLEDWIAQPLTKRGKQRVVRYDIGACVGRGIPARRFQWVGKYYDRDDEAARVATVLRALAATDCGARGAVVIPGLVAYHAALRLLVVTYEAGASVISAIAQHHEPALEAKDLEELGGNMDPFHLLRLVTARQIQPRAGKIVGCHSVKRL